ncbi:carbohydrate sulfotransferase 1-like isoform X2 [Limulus polyphemus]|uniref:Carbohydrate sulfotransferase 1-like isoform X2 n=1 Tax=Limulus polyphemus TaxID=6850 RepID=A0ABM1S8H7_LIMPO|nr:carbohydrate sulfotransferase 1-like isoform X2 [Limulus polyphemus]
MFTHFFSAFTTSSPPPKELHVILMTYARGGSSFLGDLLQSHPSVFYLFEPLHYFGSEIVLPQIPTSRQFLSDIFRCNFKNWDSFMIWAKQNVEYKNLQRNNRFWTACSLGKNQKKCYDVHFITSFCQRYLIKVVKAIRFSLNQVEEILEKNKDLNLKIIHMIRDPRGIMKSRLMEKAVIVWCQKSLCSDSRSLCTQITDDLTYACEIKAKFPGKYKLLRYEDLAQKPLETARDIFQFLGEKSLPEEVTKFLASHTKVTKFPVTKEKLLWEYTTFRNSSATAVSWVKELPFDSILKIQSNCKDVFNRMSYINLNTFSQINYTIPFKETFDENNVC